MSFQAKPDLSVVIAIVSDTTSTGADSSHLAGCLDAFANQSGDLTLELIVPYHAQVEGMEAVIERFPDAVYLLLDESQVGSIAGGGREHHDVLRAHGLLAATADIVAVAEDHARPDRHWCQNLLVAHQDDVAAVGGAIENDVERPLNWAVYFCDFCKYQNPLPAGESWFASDANSSYKRAVLQSIQSTWEGSFREVVVNGELRQRGEKLVLRPDVIMYQHRTGLSLMTAVRERYIWGRSYGATRNALLSSAKRLVYAALCPALPAVLVARMVRTTWARRRLFSKLMRSIHLILLLQVSWSVGEAAGYLLGVRPAGTTADEGSSGAPSREPVSAEHS